VSVYQWKQGKKRSADPQQVGERINRLGGDVHRVVEDARDPDSPAHELFEWNDEQAAHQHRLWQGRHIIRSLEIVIEKNGEQRATDAFVNIKIEDDEEPKQQYVPWQSMIEDPDMRQLYEQSLLRDIQMIQRKYADFKEFSEWEPLFLAIESALGRGEGDELHP